VSTLLGAKSAYGFNTLNFELFQFNDEKGVFWYLSCVNTIAQSKIGATHDQS
jgi:hypothetical protein